MEEEKWGRRGLPEKPKNPGDLAELDTMFVGFNTGRRIAVLNAIDVVSREAWSLAAAGATAASAKCLLESVCAGRMPKALQVDGGSEFRGVFEDACMELGIPLHVLPPRSPKLNGRVEAFNGTLRREFFNYFDLPDNVTELNPVLQEFMHEYHHVRPHSALGLRTPRRVPRRGLTRADDGAPAKDTARRALPPLSGGGDRHRSRSQRQAPREARTSACVAARPAPRLALRGLPTAKTARRPQRTNPAPSGAVAKVA